MVLCDQFLFVKQKNSNLYNLKHLPCFDILIWIFYELKFLPFVFFILSHLQQFWGWKQNVIIVIIITIQLYIYTYIHIYIYKAKLKNELTPSQKKTLFFSYYIIFLLSSKFWDLRTWSHSHYSVIKDAIPKA